MYMMEKLDALKQEIGKDDAVRQWEMERWGKSNARPRQEALLEYAHEMLKIHDDLKKYCNALTVKTRETQSKYQAELDKLIFAVQSTTKDYAALDKKYKALKKKVTPAKKPAATKVAKPKGT